MFDDNFGVIVFLVLIVAFIVYIIAAAMRDKKRKASEEDEDAFDDLNAVQTGTPAPPETDPARYCYHCMTKLTGPETVCPACGEPVPAREKPGHLPVGTVLAGRYTTGLAIAENRTSVAYIALDRSLEDRFCVREFFPKELSRRAEHTAQLTVEPGAADGFEAARQKFIREIRQLYAMNGFSSALNVTDLFFANGTVYAVTEYTEARSLTEYLAENGRFSPEYALALFEPVIRQLEREQAMGLLRCNLSPDSFTFCDGSLKLEGTGTPGGSVAAFLKPGYAPEELYRKSGTPGTWTDVYSLCAVMYLCVTGVAPDEASERVYQDGLREPSSLGVYLSAAFEEALMKGLSVYREERLPDCAALYRAVYLGKPHTAGQETFYRPIVDPLPDEETPAPAEKPFREPVDNEI